MCQGLELQPVSFPCIKHQILEFQFRISHGIFCLHSIGHLYYLNQLVWNTLAYIFLNICKYLKFKSFSNFIQTIKLVQWKILPTKILASCINLGPSWLWHHSNTIKLFIHTLFFASFLSRFGPCAPASV